MKIVFFFLISLKSTYALLNAFYVDVEKKNGKLFGCESNEIDFKHSWRLSYPTQNETHSQNAVYLLPAIKLLCVIVQSAWIVIIFSLFVDHMHKPNIYEFNDEIHTIDTFYLNIWFNVVFRFYFSSSFSIPDYYNKHWLTEKIFLWLCCHFIQIICYKKYKIKLFIVVWMNSTS